MKLAYPFSFATCHAKPLLSDFICQAGLGIMSNASNHFQRGSPTRHWLDGFHFEPGVRTLLHWSCASHGNHESRSVIPESWPCTSLPLLDSSITSSLLSYHSHALLLLKKVFRQILEPVDDGLLFSLVLPHTFALSRLIVYSSYDEAISHSRILRANPHTDPAFITLIAACDSDGLELFTNDDCWFCPDPASGQSLFLAGEWLKYFYPDSFQPQLHRVRFRDSIGTRTSLQTFLLVNPYNLLSSGIVAEFGDLPVSRVIDSYLKKYINYVPESRWHHSF